MTDNTRLLKTIICDTNAKNTSVHNIITISHKGTQGQGSFCFYMVAACRLLCLQMWQLQSMSQSTWDVTVATVALGAGR